MLAARLQEDDKMLKSITLKKPKQLYDGWDQEMDGFKRQNPNIILSNTQIKEDMQKNASNRKRNPISLRLCEGRGSNTSGWPRRGYAVIPGLHIFSLQSNLLQASPQCVCVCDGGVSMVGCQSHTHTHSSHNQCT